MAYRLHHEFDNLILNQGCSHKYNNNENRQVDNNEIIIRIVLENEITIRYCVDSFNYFDLQYVLVHSQ